MFNFAQTIVNAIQHAEEAQGKTGVEKKQIAMDFAAEELSRASGLNENLSEDVIEGIDKTIELLISFTKNHKKDKSSK
jgi:hypothetical protein